MRLVVRLWGFLLLAVFAVSCDTDQPLQVTSGTLEINIRATGSTDVLQVNAFEGFEDNDMDNMSDDGTTFLHCRPPAGNPTFPARSVPWNFAAQLSIIRAGTRTEEIIVPYSGDSNAASYDTFEGNATTFLQPITVDDNGTPRRFVFRPGRLLSVANRDVTAATSNPLNDIDPVTYDYLNGLCSLQDPGPASLGGVTLPFTLQMNKGDTVIFRAAKSIVPPNLSQIGGTPVVLVDPTLDGDFFLDGLEVEAIGTSASQFGVVGSGIDMAFTVR